MKGPGLRKSLPALLLFQIGVTLILYHENTPNRYILGLWTLPLGIFLMVSAIDFITKEGELLAGLFFLILFGVGMVTVVPIVAKPFVLILSALWFSLYLDLRDVDWTGRLAEAISNLTPWKRLFLIILTALSTFEATYKLLKDSQMSSFGKFLIILAYLTVFTILLKIVKLSKNAKSGKGTILFPVFIYLLINMQISVDTKSNADFLLLTFIVPFTWTVLLALIGFSKSARYQGKEDEAVAFPAHDTQRITEKTQPNMPAEGD
ncbi:hypothetical protein [Thermococcus sp. AM4]|uniref:hypothetical protein n=1 Tax=Thermococcus sp. (strain AM4) TaxID=246969 RepID=UPI0001870DCF|nr:hypothetical protein [Thermococcus sp. AM4]